MISAEEETYLDILEECGLPDDENAFWFEKSRRLDRLYLSGNCLTAKRIELGANTLDNHGQMPSDHFAVKALVSLLPQCESNIDNIR